MARGRSTAATVPVGAKDSKDKSDPQQQVEEADSDKSVRSPTNEQENSGEEASENNDADGSNLSSARSNSTTSSAASEDINNAGETSGKPTKEELIEDSKKIEEEAKRLGASLIEDKLALVNKQIYGIEKGDDPEWVEKLEELQANREKKLQVARERCRLATESTKADFEYASKQIEEELHAAKSEVLLAQQFKGRIKADQHAVYPMGPRDTAGREFSMHVECQIPSEQIEEDLQLIRKAANTKQSGEGQKSRKHSLDSSHSDELAKVRRKSE